MKLNEHTERLIAEKAKSFEKNPPPEIWDAILAGIQPEKKRLMPVLFKYAAGVALLVAASASLLLVFRSDPTERIAGNDEIRQEIQPERNQPVQPYIQHETTATETETVNEQAFLSHSNQTAIIREKRTETVLTSGNRIENIPAGQEESIQSLAVGTGILLAGLPAQIKPGDPGNDEIRRKYTEREYSWDDLEIISREENTESQTVSLAAILSPIYSYRDIVNSDVKNNLKINEKGKFSYSGGMEMGFLSSGRFSLHAGLVYSRLGYQVDGVSDVSSPANIDWLSSKSASLANQEFEISNSIGAIAGEQDKTGISASNAVTEASMDFVSGPTSYSRTENALNSNLSVDQFLNFMEVPFNVKYLLVDRKVDLKLIGGLSTNFLVGSKVLVNDGTRSENLGPTTDIRKVNYSGNLGFGIDYILGKDLVFLLEPQFKYYLNSINNPYLIGNRPYTFGFYTGVRYLFR